MAQFHSLAHRIREPEDIDDPALDTAGLHGALHGLTTINLLSASAGLVWKPIARLARQSGGRQLRVLDIATGAGDVPRALWKKAARAGFSLEIHGIDISARAIEFARERAAACGAQLTFSQRDALAEPLPTDYDVVMCSLFLHHLDEEPAVQLLRVMAAAARKLVLVNDLRRGWYGLLLAHFAGLCLTRSPVVRVDAVRSVRAAFTLAEARDLAAAAGLAGATVSRRWPARYLLSWQGPEYSLT